MAKLNVFYHEQTNSWWVNQNITGFEVSQIIKSEPIGLGTIEYDTNNKDDLSNGRNYEVESMYIPNYIKKLSGLTPEKIDNMILDAESGE